MEQDKLLKKILMNSADGTSAQFTDAVMKKVSHSASSFSYQPLVPQKLKNAFVFAFGAIVAAILFLCFIITLGNLDIGRWIQNIPLPEVNFNRLLVFIIIFWMVFAVNKLMEKYFHSGRDRFA